MPHLVFHFLLRWTLYPLFYWVGFGVIKALSLGRASILPYEDYGQEESVTWYEFYVRRFGIKFWLPETMIMIGAGVLGLLVGAIYLWHNLS